MDSAQPYRTADRATPTNDTGRAARVRLFALLAEGERIAFHIASREALLATEPSLQQFFRRQAAQEARHAAIFDRVVAYFGREIDVAAIRASAAFNVESSAIAQMLARAVASGNLPLMVIGLQGVIEGVGVAILESMRPALHADGALFEPIRRLVLAKERAHQHIGERALADAMSDGRITYSAAASALSDSLACAHSLLLANEEIFERVGRSTGAMCADVTLHAEAFLLATRRIQTGRSN